MDTINRVFASYEDSSMSRAEMLKSSRRWQASENRLRGEVSDLYIEARAGDCL